MPTNYANEQKILDEIHELEPSQCLILSDSEDSSNYIFTADVLETILNDSYLSFWKDNSKSQTPPDFVNDTHNLMMEVMRIDDHSADGKENPALKREREMHKELKAIKHLLPNAQNNFCISDIDLPTEIDHNYKNLYTSFQRTVRKHRRKIEKYRIYHPNKKMIFLVMNETSGIYFESYHGTKGRPHLLFFDNRFLNEFVDYDIDYLIMYSPFNYHQTSGEHFNLPKLVIFDVKHLKNSKMMQFIDYDETRMKSNEL